MYCSLHAAAATAAAHREVAVGALELIAAPAVHAQDVHASAYAGASREKELFNKQNTHPQLLVYSEFLSDIAATYSSVSVKYDVVKRHGNKLVSLAAHPRNDSDIRHTCRP